MSPVEYAWTNFFQNPEIIEASSQATAAEPRFHPTQKPVDLYEEILRIFAQPGARILDTHAGSASSMIAAYNMHFDYTGFEIDTEYYNKAMQRYQDHTAQLRMF